MRCRSAVFVCVLVSSCAVSVGSAQTCGVVLSIPCCTDENPGGCGCGNVAGACRCIKEAGVAQNGVKKECQTGPFTYSEVATGGNIVLQRDPMLCYILKRCHTESGSAFDCAELPDCAVPPGGGCSWRHVGSAVQTAYKPGASCGDGGICCK